MERLVGFPVDPRHPSGGFAYLDECGRPRPEEPVHTWITGRMTHVYALAHLSGIPGAGELVDHGVAALSGLLRDQEQGGWFSAVDSDGSPHATKDAYQHAFVVLGASSAAAAERADARPLLDAALDVFETRFWDDEAGCFVESFDRDWSGCEPYRGANSNMHGVEACLAAGDVTGDPRWHARALRVATSLIQGFTRENGWRLVEHFDADWVPLLEHNRDEPAHPFRPYGTTVGHWLEWSRLLLQLEASLPEPPDWLLPAAQELFQASVDVGWAPDGLPGFVYTLGWSDQPVISNRLHWVVTEGIATAATLHERTGAPVYEYWYRRLWDHAAVAFIDREGGSWHHELDPELQVTSGTWAGKPDLYHAVQATRLPQLALAPSVATQLARLGQR